MVAALGDYVLASSCERRDARVILPMLLLACGGVGASLFRQASRDYDRRQVVERDIRASCLTICMVAFDVVAVHWPSSATVNAR
jgi:hypothetical protein